MKKQISLVILTLLCCYNIQTSEQRPESQKQESPKLVIPGRTVRQPQPPVNYKKELANCVRHCPANTYWCCKECCWPCTKFVCEECVVPSTEATAKCCWKYRQGIGLYCLFACCLSAGVNGVHTALQSDRPTSSMR